MLTRGRLSYLNGKHLQRCPAHRRLPRAYSSAQPKPAGLFALASATLSA